MQKETPMHTTKPVPNNYHNKIPTCMVLFTEEGVMIRVKEFEKKEGINLGGNAIWNFFGFSLKHHLPYVLSRGAKNKADA